MPLDSRALLVLVMVPAYQQGFCGTGDEKICSSGSALGTFICADTGQLDGSFGDDLLVMTWSNAAAAVSNSCHVARPAVSSPHLLVLWDVAVDESDDKDATVCGHFMHGP